jgi:hypothetical protein
MLLRNIIAAKTNRGKTNYRGLARLILSCHYLILARNGAAWIDAYKFFMKSSF